MSDFKPGLEGVIAFETEASSPESAGLNYRVRITGAVPLD